MALLLEKINAFRQKDAVKKTAAALFFAALTIEILILIIDKSALMNPYEGRLFQITFGLFFLSFLLTEYSIREYILLFVFALFGLFVDQAADRNEILRFVVFAAAMRAVPVKKALSFTLCLSAAGMAVLALLSAFGIFGDLRIPKEYPGGTSKMLYAFGVGNANSFHCMVFVLTLLYMYLYAGKIRLWGYGLLLFLDAVLAVLTRSKTGCAVMGFSVAAMAVLDLTERGSLRFSGGERKEAFLRFIGKLCLFANVLFVGISLWFASDAWKVHEAEWGMPEYEGSLIFRADRILTGRIAALTALGHWDGALQSFRWFPEKGHEAYFDLGFVRLFYWYGIWAALLILGVFAYLLIRLYRKKEYTTLVFLTLMSFYTVVEAHFVSVYIARNYALFILGAEFFGNLRAAGGSGEEMSLPDVKEESDHE